MPVNILTTEDLKEFKKELLEEIREILNEDKAQVIKKEWLKSSQVMDILNISPGTLQRFRQNGTLSFTKIGGLIFYEAGQIEKILTDNHVKNTKRKR
ncbi:helix-turn-helix domain-containing protein [Arenibacter sp. S6351L]|uniref:helix-turn-helix domain-containing protein n=1 Tax=Arenibacter sp. S6351L TaxID=2926407 RepID=UPI001FF25365|nr:helix-turn-helix domain-containing protein [Arenibacter sp. S6351L]MCK0135890.1 helix-turn-helix domain-containing protein [Arenibacter sp. S6351L]